MAGQRINIDMHNNEVAGLLVNAEVDQFRAQEHISSDHMLIYSDYYFGLLEQDVQSSPT